MRRTAPPIIAATVLALSSFPTTFGDSATTSLDARLALEDATQLAKEARESGDPTRGALVFFRPSLQCAKCHTNDDKDKTPPLGPDLARSGRPRSDRHVVESILNPSKEIRQGFESVTVATRDGKTLTGILAGERPDALLVRDPARNGAVVTIALKEIEQCKVGGPSLMPAGLVNQLADRREFLDLVRYVLDVSEQGPARAVALRPPESAIAVPPLPDYERHVDHAGIIASLGVANYRRGEAIYDRVCINCHGTKDRPGSLPMSLRFASGAFKNGADPFRMYQTLTHGFGQMVPQSWMVPEQKYNVIHYIREAYLKPHNPSQYVRVDRAYIAGLPKGDTRGPRPTTVEPWVTMDYGPSLSLTCEVGNDGSNFAYKGIAVRLDAGPGGVSRGRAWTVFEHDTLRLAAG
jgi:putative heme-binding domain-containing protein